MECLRNCDVRYPESTLGFSNLFSSFARPSFSSLLIVLSESVIWTGTPLQWHHPTLFISTLIYRLVRLMENWQDLLEGPSYGGFVWCAPLNAISMLELDCFVACVRWGSRGELNEHCSFLSIGFDSNSYTSDDGAYSEPAGRHYGFKLEQDCSHYCFTCYMPFWNALFRYTYIE